MSELELIFSLLVLMTVLVAVARRTSIPYPIFLVLGGLLISLIPGLPHVELESELVFLLFLPPILTSAGFFTPIRDFRANLRSIMLLAIGLVLFTTTFVAGVAYAVVPALPLAAAFALGAIVAPPDAIAATSIAQRLNLPRRIVTVLEGESLMNDASALVAYRVAVAAAVTGSFSFAQAGIDFVLASVGGVVIGLALGWIVVQLLRLLNDTLIEILVTFIGSYAAYLLAESFHVSGVLAAVTIGIYTGRHSARVMAPATRLQGTAVWNLVIFLFNGLVFILIGLQLPTVLATLTSESFGTLLWYAVAVSLATILARIIWMPLGAYLARWHSSIRARDPYPSWKNITIVSWAGMRGIVSLAAALALPDDFPQRNLIIFLTFCVILATLVGQGLTLPLLIRRLKVVDDGKLEREEVKARFVAARAGLEQLDTLAGEDWVRADHIDDLRLHYEARYRRFEARYHGDTDGDHETVAEAQERLQLTLLDAEVAAVVKLRDDGVINDEVLWRVQRDLDLERLRIDGHES